MRYAMLLLLCGVIAGGCADSKSAPSESPRSSADVSKASPAAQNATAAPPGSPGAAQTATNRKIISTVSLDLVVQEFGGVQQEIERLIQKTPGAYISEAVLSGTRGYSRTGRWTIRVPQASYDATTTALRGLGEISQENKTSQEVTEEFVDLAARIKSKQETEQRLLKIQADRTASLDQVLVAEREVARVREEIERMAGRLNRLDDLVSLTTIRLNVSEIRTLQTGEIAFSDRLGTAWGTSVTRLLKLGQNTLLFVVTVAPWLPILAVAALALRLLIRRLNRPRPLTIRG